MIRPRLAFPRLAFPRPAFPRLEPIRRSRRDWVVDISLFVLAAVFSVITAVDIVRDPELSRGALVADQIMGALACCALFLRRRWPVALALVLVPVGLFSHYVAGPYLVALFTVAVHRPPRTVALVAGIAFVPVLIGSLIRPDPELPVLVDALLGLLLVGTAIGWGMFVRSRRQLRASLIEQAQRATRETIAREMHDVLAHRLSLLSLHAGALEYHAHAPAQEIQRAAGVVRQSAHEALEELRDIIGVLRAEPGAGNDSRPQPTLADLPRLIEESERAGVRVRLEKRLAQPDQVPETTGRTVYRIVQEGLTNIRKHAPGAEATVTVDGRPGEWLTADVSNSLASGPGEAIPGAGQGLVGLTERVSLAGGRLEHGRIGDTFRLYAWLPWRP
ncbi:sensor histidine kinase [Streptomyces gobiensis]|uniref:sensor histidine kinase n=1 Tax=Streptomyces gobiensis TaxID=2875706 RepID=UPI001E389BBF|nr:histidine kinase [Streptomyces gobiensis]UGY94645.1 histidine kinase [Streptomyces gobiensis]